MRAVSTGRGREAPIQYGLALLTVVLVAAPLIPILYQAVIDRPLYDSGQQFTLNNFVELAGTGEFITVLINTFLFAIATTVIAQVLGTGAAVLIGRTDMPYARLIGEMFLWPIYVSALILSFGWYAMYGPSGYLTLLLSPVFEESPWDLYTLTGMAVMAGVSLAPVAFLYCTASAGIADPALEEAARVSGAGTMRTLVRITLPLLKPAIFYSAVLNFTVALELLSIPLVFGGPANIEVLSTFLLRNVIGVRQSGQGTVATAAVFLLVIVCVLVWLQARLLGNTRRYETLGGKATRPRPFALNALRIPAFLLACTYLLFAVMLPLGTLILRAFTSFLSPLVPVSEVLTFDNFTGLLAFDVAHRSIVNSFLISIIGGALATLLVASIAIVCHRSEFPFRKALQYIALFPRAVPGVVAGLGFFYALTMIPGIGGIRNTIWIMIIAFTMHLIPAGFGAVAPILLQISPDLDRAARVKGADWLTTSRRIVLPLMKPALVACYTILFIAFFKEYSTAMFLFAPGSEVIGTTQLNLWTGGEMGQAAALAAIQIAVIGTCVGVARTVFGVRLYG